MFIITLHNRLKVSTCCGIFIFLQGPFSDAVKIAVWCSNKILFNAIITRNLNRATKLGEIDRDQARLKMGYTRRDIYLRQITRKNENDLARTHGEPSGIFVLLSSTARAILQNGNLCVWVCQHEGNLSRHASIMWTLVVRKVKPHFPRILKHSPYIGRTWCITIAGVKLRLCISGVPERADITVYSVERKFLRINHVTMENACKINTLISYEMFHHLYCRCTRRA